MLRRGATILELLVVVAIVAILGALSAYSLQAVNEIGRLNGAAESLANVLRNARARAITERCTYVVQITGVRYNPLAAPVDVSRAANTIMVWRKNNCVSNIGAYEPGLAANLRDRLVNDYNLSEFGAELRFPAGITAGNRLINASVSIGWRGDGTRMVWADDDVDGTSVDTGVAGDFNITLQRFNGNADPNRIVSVPAGGPAVAP